MQVQSGWLLSQAQYTYTVKLSNHTFKNHLKIKQANKWKQFSLKGSRVKYTPTFLEEQSSVHLHWFWIPIFLLRYFLVTFPVWWVFSSPPPGICLFSFTLHLLTPSPLDSAAYKGDISPILEFSWFVPWLWKHLSQLLFFGSLAYFSLSTIFSTIIPFNYSLFSSSYLYSPFKTLPEFMLGIWWVIIYCQVCRQRESALNEKTLGMS